MNIQLLKKYIAAYKSNFGYISSQELYKWKAVKCFQDNWDIAATDFTAMLKSSIQKTVNLLKSGQYFPLRMIVNYSVKEPERVRTIFASLFDEEVDIFERINNFKQQTEEINDAYYPGKQAYQDHRAVIVYLSLRYPERYYLYKFKMYRILADKLNLAFKPKMGRVENIGHFNTTCSLIKYYLSQDQELLKLHKDRIADDCYYDENLHILTQDFIYAIAEYIDRIKEPHFSVITINSSAQPAKANEMITRSAALNFVGYFVNFIENSIEAKRIGDLGELWVLEQEKQKLLKAGLAEYIGKIKHVSNESGDGMGYDIESYDLNKNKIYIEVKTTKYNKNFTFYISRHELERSKIEKGNFYLYRVYNYNEETNEANCFIIQGDLINICNLPISYQVNLIE